MTLYARSDVMSVGVSAEGHQGCGRTHSRPVDHGAPVKLWALDCPACEDHLRFSDLWADTPADIPETHNEETDRKDFEKRGAKDKDALMALAVARLAGIDPDDLPSSLTQMISGVKAHVPQTANGSQTVNCPYGHPNPMHQKFCGECGVPVNDPLFLGEITPEPVTAPAPPEPPQTPPVPSLPSNTKMRGMKREDLADLAAGAGLSTAGTRQEVLDRLITTNKSKVPGGV